MNKKAGLIQKLHMKQALVRAATDVGGTFTDLVYYEYDIESQRFNALKTAKVNTTPPDFEKGVLDVLRSAEVAPDSIHFFAHGTTVVINAITERKGVKVGLLTTQGFRDVLEIARGNRPDLFNYSYVKPPPFVPRHLRREIPGRINYKGEVIQPLVLDDLSGIIDDFRDERVDAVAICLLHSYVNPDQEIELAEAVRATWADVDIVSSHEVTREWREYERSNTVVLSSYIHPIANRYLGKLQAKLNSDGFSGNAYIMQSNGGIDTVDSARRSPVSMIESGPASGVLGAAALGDLLGVRNIIALDIGGTTAKCSLIEDGRVRISTEYLIEKTQRYAGYPILTPVVDIVEIGAGGGSIIWADEGRKLHVGPESAGAVPGPAAYGRGGMRPTLTDANLVTGRIDPEYFLGGRIKADMESIAKAFRHLCKRLDMSMEEISRGAIRIANNNMINALKLVSVNRGYDPRDFTLVAFGGGGAMHASALAAELHIGKVIVPNNASVFSAWGMLMSDLRRDYVVTKPTELVASSATEINHMYRALEQQAASEFSTDGIEQTRLRFERYADMRYHGQEHTVKVPYPEGAVTTNSIDLAVDIFQREYEREYTYRLDTTVELISYHVVAFGNVDKPRPQKLERRERILNKCIRGYRQVDFDVVGVHEATIYERTGLEPGMQIFGPAIVEEPDTTVVLFPQQELTIDDYGNLRIQTNTSST